VLAAAAGQTQQRGRTRARVGASWHCGGLCVTVQRRRPSQRQTNTSTVPFRDSVLHNNAQQPDTQASPHIELPFPSPPCLPSHRAVDSQETRNPTHNSLCAHCHGLALHSSTRLTSAGVDTQKQAGTITLTTAFTSNSLDTLCWADNPLPYRSTLSEASGLAACLAGGCCSKPTPFDGRLAPAAAGPPVPPPATPAAAADTPLRAGMRPAACGCCCCWEGLAPVPPAACGCAAPPAAAAAAGGGGGCGRPMPTTLAPNFIRGVLPFGERTEVGDRGVACPAAPAAAGGPAAAAGGGSGGTAAAGGV
jgi:hypothetical protein